MITDNDIKKLKTVFATKDELKQYATKDEVKFVVDQAIDRQNEVIDEKLTTFRSDIMNKLDLVISELQDKRDEQDVITHQLSDHEDRIAKLETASALAN